MSSSPTQVANPAIPYPWNNDTFFKLPPEIRFKIYSLVLKDPNKNGIRITSIKRRGRKDLSFTSLLRVNKRFYKEASPHFYSQNKFVFGNYIWGSSTDPNEYAFREFKRYIPKKHLACIKEIDLVIELDKDLWQVSSDDERQKGLGRTKEFRSLTKSISKLFSGVMCINIRFWVFNWPNMLINWTPNKKYIGKFGVGRSSDLKHPLFTRHDAVNVVQTALAIRNLLGLDKLKKVRIARRDWLNLQHVLDRVHAENGAAKGVVKLWTKGKEGRARF